MDVQSPTVDENPVFGTNPEIFKLGIGKQHVLAHEIGQGSQCRNQPKCRCEGLDLHFWRKMCKACGCRMDEHDVVLPHELDHAQIVIGRLFGAREHFENTLHFGQDGLRDTPKDAHKTAVYSVQFSPSERETNKEEVKYAWAPINDKNLVERYMDALPVEERPIVGTAGEQNRKSRLQYQLPLYDSNLEDARFIDVKDVETSRKFIENMKKNVIGVGQVVELDKKQQEKCHCQKCEDNFRKDNIAVSCKQNENEDESTWHPNCLRCATCDQLLVDNIFFQHEGKYYCGRHYSDQLYPRCNGCDELIFAIEYTFAEDASWHFDHFACYKCDFKLGGSRYMTKENNPYCLKCYLQHFAKTCNTCKAKIGPDEKRLNYNDVHWHAQEKCFQCSNCSDNLIGKKFIMKNDNLFCSSTCRAEFNKKHGIF